VIQKHSMLPGTTYRIKLSLPIPTPAEYDQRRFAEALALHKQAFQNMDEAAERNMPDARSFLADRLKTAAIYLSRSNVGKERKPSDWQPDWQLENALEPTKHSRPQGRLSASGLGEVLAQVEYFFLSSILFMMRTS
jgi:hypothetical protein